MIARITRPASATAKWQKLQELLTPYVKQGALIAFSGGVDSAFLLWAAVEAAKNKGGRATAFTTYSASLPVKDKQDAIAFSRQIEVEHIWRESSELSDPLYLQNDALRCYHCKNELFIKAWETAREQNLAYVMYGYSASDGTDDRPGHRAAKEQHVIFPLKQAGLLKDDIRTLMSAAGFEIADKPASPCLSSRIGRGIPVTTGRLSDIAALEQIIARAGGTVFRVRIAASDKGHFIRIETTVDEMPMIVHLWDRLDAEGKRRGYKWVTLDLGGYKTGGANR